MYSDTTCVRLFFKKEVEITELCPRVEEQFRFFKRVRYENLGTITEESLIEHLRLEDSALCIVNTKKMAQDIYKELQGEGVYHLSASMYPKHSKRIRGRRTIARTEMERIVQRKNAKGWTVLYTSLCERAIYQ